MVQDDSDAMGIGKIRRGCFEARGGRLISAEIFDHPIFECEGAAAGLFGHHQMISKAIKRSFKRLDE